jgi:phage repressor protein C with HTH and peptisase S24 domain
MYRLSDYAASGISITENRTLNGMLPRERTPFGQRLHEARKAAKLTQPELAKLAGMSQSTLAEAEYTAQGSSFTAQLAQACKVRAEWLASGDGPRTDPPAEPQPEYAGTRSGVRRVSIVGTARLAEGEEGFYDEISSVPGAGDGHIDIATADPNAYGLRVRGNSMTPAIRDGWYVLIEPNAQPAVGEYVLVKLRNGQKMVKELLYRRLDSIEVLSVNSGQRRTIYTDELESIQAVAAVVSPSKWKPD